MLRVRPIDAKAGMEVALPVFHPQRHSVVLLKPGILLDEWSITRLHELNAPEVWIRYPELDIVAPWVNAKVHEARARVAGEVAHAFDRARAGVHADLDYVRYAAGVRGLMRTLEEAPKAALFMGDLVESGQPAVQHATHVAYLSLLIGLKLDFYLERERAKLPPAIARNVTNLGVAAMLHDLGMTRLPDAVVEHWHRTHDEHNEAWRDHVRLGYHMVRGSLEPTAAAAVLHHHQKFDGTGFPMRTKLGGELVSVAGHDIHIFARIIAAADLFDRLCHPAAEDPRPVVRVLRMLQDEPYRNWLDPVVFSALLEVCPPYPPGTRVALSDGRFAAVVGWTPSEPCRPEVALLGDLGEGSGNADRDPETIDLRLSRDLRIVAVDGVDVSGDHFDLPAGASLSAIARTLREMPVDEATLERSARWDLEAG